MSISTSLETSFSDLLIPSSEEAARQKFVNQFRTSIVHFLQPSNTSCSLDPIKPFKCPPSFALTKEERRALEKVIAASEEPLQGIAGIFNLVKKCAMSNTTFQDVYAAVTSINSELANSEKYVSISNALPVFAALKKHHYLANYPYSFLCEKEVGRASVGDPEETDERQVFSHLFGLAMEYWKEHPPDPEVEETVLRKSTNEDDDDDDEEEEEREESDEKDDNLMKETSAASPVELEEVSEAADTQERDISDRGSIQPVASASAIDLFFPAANFLRLSKSQLAFDQSLRSSTGHPLARRWIEPKIFDHFLTSLFGFSLDAIGITHSEGRLTLSELCSALRHSEIAHPGMGKKKSAAFLVQANTQLTGSPRVEAEGVFAIGRRSQSQRKARGEGELEASLRLLKKMSHRVDSSAKLSRTDETSELVGAASDRLKHLLQSTGIGNAIDAVSESTDEQKLEAPLAKHRVKRKIHAVSILTEENLQQFQTVRKKSLAERTEMILAARKRREKSHADNANKHHEATEHSVFEPGDGRPQSAQARFGTSVHRALDSQTKKLFGGFAYRPHFYSHNGDAHIYSRGIEVLQQQTAAAKRKPKKEEATVCFQTSNETIQHPHQSSAPLREVDAALEGWRQRVNNTIDGFSVIEEGAPPFSQLTHCRRTSRSSSLSSFSLLQRPQSATAEMEVGPEQRYLKGEYGGPVWSTVGARSAKVAARLREMCHTAYLKIDDETRTHHKKLSQPTRRNTLRL